MIRLDLKREPTWLDLGHGVGVHVRPCTTALVMAARAAVARERADASAHDEAALGLRTAGFIKALARLAVDEWEGVGDAKGKPAAVTPEGVAALMDLWPIAESFERQYLGPALLLDAEKNAWRPAPDGISVAGLSIARAAGATAGPVPGASPVRVANSAPTSRTSR